jgi:hypothetical protein
MSATDANEFEGHEELVAELRANPPAAPERLRQRVLEGAPGARRRMSRRRKLVLVVVPVAVALSVGAAVVHGFVSSGASSFRATDKQTALSTLNGSAAGKTVQHGGTVKKHVFANQALTQAPATTVAAAGSPIIHAYLRPAQRNAVAIPRNRLVHAAASLEVQEPNRSALSRATNKATQIVASLGGFAQSVHYQSAHQGYGNAVLALRVPVQKAQVAIGRLESLGKLLSQQVSTTDLQQQLGHETNQIGSLRRAIAVYAQALQSGSLSPSQRVEIQIRLSNARHALTQQRKARTGTLASGATADISLVLTTRQHAIVTPGHHRSGRFDRLLGSAGDFLALEGIVVLYALIVLGPVLLLGGLGWWLVRERRRREETRLLASA